MAISFVGVGSPSGGVGDVTPTLPSGLQAQDFMMLLVETGGAVDGGELVTAPSGWTSMSAAGPAQGTSGQGATRLSMFYRFYQSGDGNPTITDPGDHAISQIAAFRGVDLASPFTTRNFSSSSNATTRTTAALTVVTDQLLCIIGTNSLNQIPTITNSAGLTQTQRVFLSTTNGDDGALRFYTAPISSGGTVTGTTTVTTSDAVLVVAFALNPLATNNHTAAGTTQAVTGAAEVSLRMEHTVTGTLQAVTGAASMTLTLEHVIAGTLAAVEGSAAMDNAEPPLAEIDATVEGILAAVTGAAEVVLIMEHTISGTLGAVTGAATVELIQEVTIAPGALNPISATAEIEIEKACYTAELDTREKILARLDALIATVPGVVRSRRNDPEIPEGYLPAALLLDSDEELNPVEIGVRNRPAFAPRIVDLRPELYIMLQGEPVQAGKDLNVLHDEIVSMVLHDEALLALTLDRKGIRYDGTRMDVDMGRSQDAEMALDFTFTYYFNPEPLCEPLAAPVGEWLPEVGIRERILAAMARALEECEGVRTFKRNEVVTNDAALPAVMMLDGDEFAHAPDSGNGRAAHQPKRVRMEPEVYLLVNQSAALVGPKLNQLRFMVIRSVLNDALLGSLCHNFDVRYEGCQTGLSLGRSMAGEMGLKFTATYVLKP